MGSQLQTIESALPEGHRSIQSATRPKVRVASTPNFQKSPGARDIDVKATPTLTPKKIAFAAAGLGILIVIVLLISLGKKSDPKPSVVTETPAAAPSVEVAVAPAPIAAPLSSATAPAPAPQFSLELIGVEESWVNVRVGDQNAQGFSLKPGERKSFAVTPSAQIVFSNAGAVEIRWEGKTYASPGFRGDVKTLQLPSALSTLKEKKFIPKKIIAPRTAPAVETPSPEQAPVAPAEPSPETPGAR
jgi:hypothetical protein